LGPFATVVARFVGRAPCGVLGRRNGAARHVPENGTAAQTPPSLTSEGVAFVTGQTTVPKHVFLVNGKREGFSDERASIRQCLGSKFNYDELMAHSNFEEIKKRNGW